MRLQNIVTQQFSFNPLFFRGTLFDALQNRAVHDIDSCISGSHFNDLRAYCIEIGTTVIIFATGDIAVQTSTAQ